MCGTGRFMSPINYSVTGLEELRNVTCADILLRYLELEGVEYVFGVSGGTIIAILQSLQKSSAVKFIMVKHEGGASFMADMYARVSGKLGVCLSTAGPGATNMLTGVACANQDRVPLLAITGQPSTHTIGKGAVQESSGFGIDTVGIYGQFTGASNSIMDAAVFQQILTKTLRLAQSEYRQAVHVSIPSNVSSTVFPRFAVHTHRKQYRASHTAFDPELINRAASLLATARNPVILIGSAFSDPDAGAALQTIAETLECPVAATPKGKGAFPESHPLSLGVFGFAGNLSAKKYLRSKDIDLLLVIGSRLGEWTTESWDPRIFPTHYLIQIDYDSRNIGQNFPVSLGIVGDINRAVRELAGQLKKQTSSASLEIRVQRERDHKNRQHKVVTLKEKTGLYQHPEKMTSDQTPLKPQRLIRDLNECLERDAVILADAGNAYAWALHYLTINPPQRFVIALGFASMGHAAAGVIGAALAAPGRQTIAVVGDGSMLMNGSEVHTAVEYGIPVVWLVLNDAGWGMVAHGNRAVIGEELSARFTATVDFA
ncbi:MAG TPA: thiamine pyrophosphate-binding protein, partial [Spirochaetia bacterium]|nr:thiamine pyrophosphate-binding protein [Spirochaetia bacterium]